MNTFKRFLALAALALFITPTWADKIQLYIDGNLVYQSGAAPTPTPTPVPTPTPTPNPAPTAAGVAFLGDLARSPNDNLIPNMVGNVVYSKRVVLDGLADWTELRTGGMANSDLDGFFQYWVSASPGGGPIAARGCEVVRLTGNNGGVATINVPQLRSMGYGAVYFNVQSDSNTGRFMQRNP